MDERGKPVNYENLLELVNEVLGDAGGSGEFKYDGGPKPYVKKSGEVSEKSKERVEQFNSGTLPSSEPQTIPVPTEEQYAQAQALVEKYYESNLKERMQEILQEKTSQLANYYSEIEKIYSEGKLSEEGYKNILSGKEKDYDYSTSEERIKYQAEQELKEEKERTPEQKEKLIKFQQKSLASERKELQENDDRGGAEHLSKDAKFWKQNEPLTKFQKNTIRGYQFQSAHVQDYSINGPDPNESDYSNNQNKKLSDTMSKIAQSFEASKDVTVHRVLTHDKETKGSKEYVESLLNAEPGTEVHNKAFSSTTMYKGADKYRGTPEQSLDLEISIKKGQKGAIPVNSTYIGDYWDEREIILDKNSRLRVDSVDKEKRIVKLSLLDKEKPATDSIALDYTFIPEEHPRQKDPDWGGKPQEGGTGSTEPAASPATIPVPTQEQWEKSRELVEKYYSIKENRPPGIEEGGTPLDEDYDAINGSWSKEEEDEIKKIFPGAYDRYKEWMPIRFDNLINPRAQELSTERSAQHAIVNMWHNEFKKSPAGQALEEAKMSQIHKEVQKEQKNYKQRRSNFLKTYNSEQVPLTPHQEKQVASHNKSIKRAIKIWTKDGNNEDIISDFKKIEMVRPLTKAHREAIKAYQTSSDMVQGFLAMGSSSGRKGDKHFDPKELEYHVAALSDATKSFKATQDYKGYRGITLGRFKGPGSRESKKKAKTFFDNIFNAKPGDTFQNPAFSSISHSREYAEQFSRREREPKKQLTLEINVKKGQPGLDMYQAINEQAMVEQREVVLDKDSTFQIDHVDKKNRLVKISLLDKVKSANDSIAIDSVPIFHSIPIIKSDLYYVIETPKGHLRIGHGWQNRSPADYGYIVGYTGADGDEMDCYLGPNKWSNVVYVIDQNQIGSTLFDEHKCMIGYASEKQALNDYYAGHNLGKQIFRGITAMSKSRFINWLKTGNLKKSLT